MGLPSLLLLQGPTERDHGPNQETESHCDCCGTETLGVLLLGLTDSPSQLDGGKDGPFLGKQHEFEPRMRISFRRIEDGIHGGSSPTTLFQGGRMVLFPLSNPLLEGRRRAEVVGIQRLSRYRTQGVILEPRSDGIAFEAVATAVVHGIFHEL